MLTGKSDEPRSARRPSSTDVARLANVSQSAVSRTFTPGASVSPGTREKVLAAADALGYRPNLLPGMLRAERTDLVAVVAGGLANPFYADILDALAAALREAGKQVMLVRVDSDIALDEVVAELAGYRVDAVVSALAVQSDVVAQSIAAMRTPLIQLAHGATGPGIRTVNIDNGAVGREAANLLLARGGRQFAYIAGPDTPTQRRRELGFVRALAAQGIEAIRVESPSYSHAGGVEAGEALFRKGPVDALFCVNDLVACGAIDAVRTMGAANGETLRVVGVDNIAQARWPSYDLTSFDQCPAALAALVMKLVADFDALASEHLIPAVLVERASTLLGVSPP